MKKIIIGVAGKIGSGKTTFCEFAEQFGCKHINTDKIVHELYGRGGKGAKLVKEIFGPEYLKNGATDRVKLRKYFIGRHKKFDDFLKKLYPIVIGEIKKHIKLMKSPVFIEFIDFDMKNFRQLIDKLIYIECDEKLIFKRYKGKFPVEYLEQVLLIQKPPKKSDFIIFNNSTKADLRMRARDFIMNL